MAVYRSLHIQPETIAMVPVRGYGNKCRYSEDSIRWLKFVAFSEKIEIQTAKSPLGEKKICGLSVDGFCESTKTIYQYHVSIIQIIFFFVISNLSLIFFLF